MGCCLWRLWWSQKNWDSEKGIKESNSHWPPEIGKWTVDCDFIHSFIHPTKFIEWLPRSYRHKVKTSVLKLLVFGGTDTWTMAIHLDDIGKCSRGRRESVDKTWRGGAVRGDFPEECVLRWLKTAGDVGVNIGIFFLIKNLNVFLWQRKRRKRPVGPSGIVALTSSPPQHARCFLNSNVIPREETVWRTKWAPCWTLTAFPQMHNFD